MKNLKNFLLRFLLISSVVFPSLVTAASIQEEIAGLYIAFFNRAADESGLHYWEGQAEVLGTDIALKELAAGFAIHPKFTDLYADMNNQEFVEAIYINVLGQAGDIEGIAYWTDLLEKGMSRSDMVAEFVSVTLNFDLNDPQYDSLRIVVDTSLLNTTQNPLDVAQQRKDLFSNKVAVSLMYVSTLGDKTDLNEGTDASDPKALTLDKAYRASVNLLYGITYDAITKEKAFNLLEIINSSADAIDIINRLREQFGSVLQDSATIEQILSLMENLRVYNSNFGTLVSQVTQKVWMDRNLGALEVCISPVDEKCYGDYYQWGRYPDGHEKRDSSITLKVASSLFTEDDKFVISSYDWTSIDMTGTYRSQTYNVCPVGFRVPTIEELLAENISNATEAFDRLKLPVAGERDRSGVFKNEKSTGYLLSKSTVVSNNYKILKYTDTISGYSLEPRTTGASIRCIQTVEPIQWVTADWGACQGGICGISSGVQSRSVTCQDATGTLLPDSYCIDPKPITSQLCEIQQCSDNLAPVAVDDFALFTNPSIAVFDNSSYVDSANNFYASESDNIQATLTFLDYNYTAFTDTTLTGFQTALIDKQILLMPENENGTGYSSLPTDTKNFIFDFVSNGGTLIMNADGYVSGHGLTFLNEIFGWSLQKGNIFSDEVNRFQKTIYTTGTPYENAPDMILGNNATYTVPFVSLPMNSKVYYVDSSNNVAVFSKDVGSGHVIFLAYDWFNAKPIGSQDGGWVDVLNASVLTAQIPVKYSITEANEVSVSEPVTGNILENDSDPDTVHNQLSVIEVNSILISPSTNSVINGMYGSLTIDSNGDFTYDLNNSNPIVNALDEGDTLEETFTYTISDNEVDPKTDSAIFIITIRGINDGPIANAGIDQNVTVGTLVTLDGSASSDPEGDSYGMLWTIISKPTDSNAIISNSSDVNPTFTPDIAGEYIINLRVNDAVFSDDDTVIINVSEPKT